MAMKEGDHRYPCCREASNLAETERKRVPDGVLVTRTCSECGRRHFEMLADVKSFGLGR